MGILEKIKEIEFEMNRTQKNKATEGHLGSLKAKLAKLRAQLLEPEKGGSGGKGEGFDVARCGDARIALIGFPSVGKSTLLSTLTNTKSEAANYEFTTLTCIPGNISYKGAKIQMLDLPGIIEGAAYGKGRGRQVIAVAKSVDLVLMVLDAEKEKTKNHRAILERELHTAGLRLNKRPAQINFVKKDSGGIKFNSTCTCTKLGDNPAETIRRVLHEYRIHNAEILFREDATTDDLIDIIDGNRHYLPCLYAYNKIDRVSIEDVDRMAREPYSMVMSTKLKLNLDFLLWRSWQMMRLCRIYTKPRGGAPDFSGPIVISEVRTKKNNIEAVAKTLHKSMVSNFNYALVWGTSCKHSPQRCGLAHICEDEDVVQIVTKTVTQQKQSSNYAAQCQAAYDQYKQKKKNKKKPLKT
eukprot:g2604.t1